MKTKIMVFAVFFIFLCSYAQNDEVFVSTMLGQADEMGKKFIDKDYAGFLKYSHPKTIQVMGGEKQAIHKITDEMKKIEKEGISFISIKFGVPSKIISVDDELQCTIPQIMEMHIPDGIVTSTTTMIAVSTDKGKNWYFLDTVNYNLNDMKLLLPNLSDELYIPERSEPSFEPDPKEDIKAE